MPELIYPELSYRIIGICYDVYNELGGGYQEKYYQRALKERLKRESLDFKEQLKFDLKFQTKIIGRYFIDFVIDNKIVLEIKIAPIFYQRDIRQVLAYLKESGLKLGVLVSFNRKGVMFKRILKGN